MTCQWLAVLANCGRPNMVLGEAGPIWLAPAVYAAAYTGAITNRSMVETDWTISVALRGSDENMML